MRVSPTIASDQHVRRLHITVDEPARVRGVKRTRHLSDVGRGKPRLKRPALREQLAKVGALDEIHRDEKQPRLFTGPIDRDHVRMSNRGSQL